MKRPAHIGAPLKIELMISKALHILILSYWDLGKAVEPALPEKKRAS